MNIFFLADDPDEAAQLHCNEHVIKMVLESAQMLSTAQRVLNGAKSHVFAPNGRAHAVYLFPGEKLQFEQVETKKGVSWKLRIVDRLFYNATHASHPCTQWVMRSATNYRWLWHLMVHLDKERVYRYGTAQSKTITELGERLMTPPKGLIECGMTPPAQAMPDECKRFHPVDAYRAFYRTHKSSFATWKKRPVPEWMHEQS